MNYKKYFFVFFILSLFIFSGNRVHADTIVKYDFDDAVGEKQAKDLSGNGLDAILPDSGSGKARIVSEGKKKNALGLPTRESAFIIKNDPKLQITGDLTISLWVLKEDDSDTAAFVVKTFDDESIGGEDDEYWFGYEGGHLSFDFTNSDDEKEYYSGKQSIQKGVWTHIALVRDMRRKKIITYINGEKDNEEGYSGNPSVKSDWDVSIGWCPICGENYSLVGKIDNLRIYNVALSEEKIRDEMRLGTNPDPVPIDPEPIESGYRLGDKVWFDDNANGIQDRGEQGVPKVKVELLKKDCSLLAEDIDGNEIKPRFTDRGGKYLFENLNSGDYCVRFSEIPDGYMFTVKGGRNGKLDSDVDREGRAYVSLVKENLHIDAGIIDPCSLSPDLISSEKSIEVDEGTDLTLSPDEKNLDENNSFIWFKENGFSKEEKDFHYGIVKGADDGKTVTYDVIKTYKLPGAREKKCRYEDIEKFILKVNKRPTPSVTKKRGRVSRKKVCRDTEAINFSSRGFHRQSLCKYGNKTTYRDVLTSQEKEVTKPEKKEEVQKTENLNQTSDCIRHFRNEITSNTKDEKEVKKLQEFLNNFENAHIKVTGEYDLDTMKAVNNYQRKYFYDILKPLDYKKPTSYVTSTMLGHMNKRYRERYNCSLQEENACSHKFTRYLNLGSKGEEVKKVQTFLKDLGFYAGEVNGLYGKTTKEAVKKFQNENWAEVLKPWGIPCRCGTGYWYQTTMNFANKLVGCKESLPKLKHGKPLPCVLKHYPHLFSKVQ